MAGPNVLQVTNYCNSCLSA